MKTEIAVQDIALAKKAISRCTKRSDGSIVIPLQDSLYDIFSGRGWTHQSRFRIIRFRGTEGPTRKLYQVSGRNMSRDLCDQLLKEL